jgi:hypothetical protein
MHGPKKQLPGPLGALFPVNQQRSQPAHNSAAAGSQPPGSPLADHGGEQSGSIFHKSPWLTLWRHLNLPEDAIAPGAAEELQISHLFFPLACIIDDLKVGKVPRLLVFISSFKIFGVEADAQVVFQDPSGEMSGCITRNVLDEFGSHITAGAALYLTDVSVWTPCDEGEWYLNVTLANVAKVFPPNAKNTEEDGDETVSQGWGARIRSSAPRESYTAPDESQQETMSDFPDLMGMIEGSPPLGASRADEFVMEMDDDEFMSQREPFVSKSKSPAPRVPTFSSGSTEKGVEKALQRMQNAKGGHGGPPSAQKTKKIPPGGFPSAFSSGFSPPDSDRREETSAFSSGFSPPDSDRQETVHQSQVRPSSQVPSSSSSHSSSNCGNVQWEGESQGVPKPNLSQNLLHGASQSPPLEEVQSQDEKVWGSQPKILPSRPPPGVRSLANTFEMLTSQSSSQPRSSSQTRPSSQSDITSQSSQPRSSDQTRPSRQPDIVSVARQVRSPCTMNSPPRQCPSSTLPLAEMEPSSRQPHQGCSSSGLPLVEMELASRKRPKADAAGASLVFGADNEMPLKVNEMVVAEAEQQCSQSLFDDDDW